MGSFNLSEKWSDVPAFLGSQMLLQKITGPERFKTKLEIDGGFQVGFIFSGFPAHFQVKAMVSNFGGVYI